MAEGIFKGLIHKRGLSEKIAVDSAGILDYHKGDLPDPRMRQTALKHHIELDSRSRPVTRQDFSRFDYILAMDRNNLRELKNLMGSVARPEARLFIMREFDNARSGKDVDDPYYLGGEGFENCYRVLDESCRNFLDFIEKEDAPAGRQ